MLLSRFWYLLLAVCAAAAAGAALLSQGIINNKSTEQLGDALRRDRIELEAVLRMEARARLDRISFISVDSKLGGLLKQAAGTSDEKVLAKLNGEAKDVLRGHVARMVEAVGGGAKEADLTPDIAFALDQNGRILAQLGPLEVNPAGASLATYPLVDRALHGYVRDDVWIYDRRVYRMAARPVLYGGEFAGAIVHGYKFDNGFAEKISQGLGGATLAFFYGTNVLASYTPGEPGAPQVAEVAAPIPQALNDERFKTGERTEPLELQSGGRAVYSLLTGGAAVGNVGYVIARPLHLISTPQELFQNASQQEVQALPLPLLGGGAALLALLGLLFVYLERDRPYKVLLKKISEITQGERDRLIVTEWRGAYRKLADQINLAIDKSVEKAAEMAPSSKKKANLDEILGPTPQSNVEPYFGFADGDAQPSKPAVPAARAMPTPAQLPPAKPRTPETPAFTPAPMLPLPGVTATPAPALPRPAVQPPVLKAAVAPVATSLPAGPVSIGPDEFDEPTHFREVYEQYLETRGQCGEPTEGLSFEKFEQTLIKTRDQVLAKHPAKGVRFTVYVKEGKAALKAAPLKK